ncbi:endonuclease domain-containing protein [Devosia sp. BK]|uniref:endonuclease domain-containing protein n=1 Tax=unclassified Devosia TaxID=196773 RepID=UPI00138F4065|nr:MULTISPECIES: endonuclease domain-containing protein [unclassified Devosia]MDV3252247.1 endonuclease domain-containing protein [Devosia sp. BK]
MEQSVARNSLPRKLRQQPTPAEIRFWRLIHPIRQQGWHFRKQAPIGRYVVDFVCHAGKLIVEIDGDSHFMPEGIARDAARTAFLEGEGYRVLRFTNLEVMEEDEGVHLEVLGALQAAGVTPSRPPPSRGR